jgi:hypothetical protein
MGNDNDYTTNKKPAPVELANSQASSAPTKTTDSGSTAPEIEKRRWSLKLVLAVLGLIVISLALWWVIASPNQSNNQTKTQPYRYTYTNLDDYEVSSVTENSTIMFKKPVELKLYKPVNGVIDLEHFASEHSLLALASLGIQVTPNTTPITASQIDNINKTLSLPVDDPKYVAYVADLKKFLTTGQSARFSLDLGRAASFTNPNIKANAWQFDFTVTDKAAQAAKDYQKAFLYKGKLIYAVGQSTYYYFGYEAIDYNWNDNPKIWKSVDDSLKIDQQKDPKFQQ